MKKKTLQKQSNEKLKIIDKEINKKINKSFLLL